MKQTKIDIINLSHRKQVQLHMVISLASVIQEPEETKIEDTSSQM